MSKKQTIKLYTNGGRLMQKIRDKLNGLSDKKLTSLIIVFLIITLLFIGVGFYLLKKEILASGFACIVLGICNLWILCEAWANRNWHKHCKKCQEKLSPLLSKTKFTEVKFSPYVYYNSDKIDFEHSEQSLEKCKRILENIDVTYFAKLDKNGNVYVVTKLNGEFFEEETIGDLQWFIDNYVFFK